jgi:addiction module HigA family antidote
MPRIPYHPGETLAYFLEDMGITPYRLSKATGMTPTHVSQILKQQRGITAETAIRLSLFFNNTADFWLNLQKNYELDTANQTKRDTLLKRVIPWQVRGQAMGQDVSVIA